MGVFKHNICSWNKSIIFPPSSGDVERLVPKHCSIRESSGVAFQVHLDQSETFVREFGDEIRKYGSAYLELWSRRLHLLSIYDDLPVAEDCCALLLEVHPLGHLVVADPVTVHKAEPVLDEDAEAPIQ